MITSALVLAAGFGSRIARYADAPKPLLVVGGRRIIEWNLIWLASFGVRDVWVNLHHRPADFRAALGAGERYGIRLHYSEEEQILGTAGGWKRVCKEIDCTAFVIYGDNLMRFDLAALARAHGAVDGLCTVALYDEAVHGNTGIAGGHAELRADGTVAAFREAPAPAGSRWLVNAGAYVVEPALADQVADGMVDFGRDVFPGLAAAGTLRGHIIDAGGFCLGLDTPECFTRAQAMVSAGTVVL